MSHLMHPFNDNFLAEVSRRGWRGRLASPSLFFAPGFSRPGDWIGIQFIAVSWVFM